MSFAERRFTSHDGLSLYCREYVPETDEPAGTVLCLPGLTRNSKDFEGVAGHLARRWRVLSPDLRGRGRSDRDPNWKQYLPPTYVRDAWTLLDEFGVDRVIVLGTSLGGLMAMIMAEQDAARLRAVVLNDIGPEVPAAATERILEYVGRTPPQPGWASAVAQVRENYQLAFPDGDAAFWERQTRAAWRERPDGQVEPDYDPAIGDALRRVAKSGRLLRVLQRLGLRRLRGLNLDPWDNFRAMTMPVLLIRGELSDVLTRETVSRMEECKPDLRVARVPGRGHAPTLDEPAARAALDAFLSSL